MIESNTMDVRFDESAFFRAVEQRRAAERLSWRELGRKLGMSPSTFSRLSRGRRPDVDTFLKLLAWLDMPADAFVIGELPKASSAEDPLALISAALRKDPNLRPDAVAPLEDIVRIAYNSFRRPER